MGEGARPDADALVLVRPARLADVQQIHAIETASFTDPWSRLAIVSAIAAQATTAMVAEGSEGAVEGYSVAARAADEVELLNLAVRLESRGKGVGSALLERVIADARGWGARALFLEVRDSNSAARKLYARAGFEEVGRRRAYYRRPVEDALILRRVLE